MGNIRHRITRNFNLTTFTDELHSDVGASAFVLSELTDNDIENVQGHDYFTGEDLVIRTASGGGGVLLVENTDYQLTTQNDYLTEKAIEYAGTTKTVYKKIQIINATYQSGNLYFSGKYIADDLNPVDINNVTNYCKSISTDTTISDGPGYITYLVTTTDTAKTTVTLPDATKNINLIIKIMKSSDTFAPVVIDTYSTQTINNWSYTINSTTYQLVPIFFQNEIVELISDGSNWKIINGYVPTYDTGVFYQNGTYSTIGGPEVNLSGVTGSFELFEVISGGTSSQKAVVCDIGTNRLSALMSSPYEKTAGTSAIFQNTETITGGSSGASGTCTDSSAQNYSQLLYPFYNRNTFSLDSTYNQSKLPKTSLSIHTGLNWSDTKLYTKCLDLATIGTSSYGGILYFNNETTTDVLAFKIDYVSLFPTTEITNNSVNGMATGWYRLTIQG